MWRVGGVDHDAVLRHIAEGSGWTGRDAFLIVISAMIRGSGGAVAASQSRSR